VALPHRFELDSYHAIMAMVAAGAGWTIITPLGYLAAHRFRDAVAVMEMPFAPLSREIALFARRGVLGAMPGEIAARMRPLVQRLLVDPAQARMPWLGAALAVRAPG
jgi:DNA-binding transcriptional LysR family regulator